MMILERRRLARPDCVAAGNRLLKYLAQAEPVLSVVLVQLFPSLGAKQILP